MSVNVDIEITPTLGFTEQLNQLALSSNPDDLREFFFTAMAELDSLEKRLDGYIVALNKFFANRVWRIDILETLGLQILKFAFENASHGYANNEYLTDKQGGKLSTYKPRLAIVEELYRLRYGYIPSGLTTGEDKLIDSLRPGATDNIMYIKPDVGEVIVGTSWDYARVLEEGGQRENWQWDFTHLGISIDKQTGNIKPAGWLVAALGDYESALGMVYDLLDAIAQMNAMIPARPFLKPALWSVRYDKETAKEIIYALAYALQDETDKMTNPKYNDKILVKVESMEFSGIL